MPSVVIERIGLGKRSSLSNSSDARVYSLGTGWTTLRIGLRLIMTNTGVSLGSTPRLWVGLCAGTTNIIMDPTTDHFVGMYTTIAAWNYAAGPPINYGNVTGTPCKRVGAVVTDTGASATMGGGIFIADATTANRSVIMLDITKGAPNFTIRCILHRNTAVAADVTLTQFLTQMELVAPALAQHIAGTARTLAVDEAVNGFLTAVNIGWDRTTPTFEIEDVCIARIA